MKPGQKLKLCAGLIFVLLSGCAIREEPFAVGDMQQGQAKLVTSQHYPWSTPQTILVYNITGLAVVVPLTPDTAASSNLSSLTGALASHAAFTVPF